MRGIFAAARALLGLPASRQIVFSCNRPVVHEFITRRPKPEWYPFHTWRAPGTPQLRRSRA
jgi:hypothetical protein